MFRLLAILALLGFSAAFAASGFSRTEGIEVVKVIDGDTVEIESGERVRYIGINAPELAHDGRKAECYAVAARRENERLVLGKKVTLSAEAGDRDGYGRLLRHAYVQGSNVAEKLLASGHARLMSVPPNIGFSFRFSRISADARARGRGLWSACAKRSAP